MTVPQIGAMYEGDMSRKRTLVDFGFRLPSAMDNRPLRWEEFLERTGQTVYLSATPGDYELSRGKGVVEQIIRPTGLIDPEVVVKPTKGQIDDLLHEISLRTAKDERILVTTLTKKMAEDLTDYFLEQGVRVRYLHSEVDTLRRVELLRELRQGDYDVLVGINLLRERAGPAGGLPRRDPRRRQGGFLRSSKSLIQTIGRAARNVSGQVHMYADRITPSMAEAIEETNRRREKQIAYNTERGVDPMPLRKKIADITDLIAREDADTAELLAAAKGGGQGGSGRSQSRGKAPTPGKGAKGKNVGREVGPEPKAGMPQADLADLIQELTDQMHSAAAELQFELAARLRDEVGDLKKELRGMRAAQGPESSSPPAHPAGCCDVRCSSSPPGPATGPRPAGADQGEPAGPRPPVQHEDRPAFVPVLQLPPAGVRDGLGGVLVGEVVQVVVRDRDRQPVAGRRGRQALGQGPRPQHPVLRQPQVVVRPRDAVVVQDERGPAVPS